MRSTLSAFIIAITIYIPIIIWFYLQAMDFTPKPAQKDLFPLTQLQIISSDPIPSNNQPSAPAPANDTSSSAQQTIESISVDELNRIFAPAPAGNQAEDSNKTYTPTKEIQSLYGELLLDLSDEEKRYLESNLNSIGAITQKYLKYPYLAGENRMQGEAILSFTLMPNGDITPIELHKSSGFSLLDDNSIYTIEIAYKDYPQPKEPTRIRLRVLYRLY